MSRSQAPSAIPCNRPPREDGTKYRVRDREGDPPTVRDDGNGQGLTHKQATIARDRLAAEKKIRHTIIEPMPDAQAEQALADDLSVPESICRGTYTGEHDAGCAVPAGPSRKVGTEYQVAAVMSPTQIQADGMVTVIPRGHQLLVNGQERPVPTRVQKGDTVECRSLAPAVVAARAVASDAVAQVIQQRRRIPMDVTVRHHAPRATPPPPDLTVSNRPVVVRLGAPPAAPPQPLPSPLKVAPLEDGEPLPDDALTDADLPDVAGDLGGGPSDADVEHAKRQAEAERAR